MKCPKCGYLGFETTDRCRNCQYDFSLAPFVPEPDLALQDSDTLPDPDFELPARVPDQVSESPLDLDRLLGGPTRADSGSVESPAASVPQPPAPVRRAAPAIEETPVVAQADSGSEATDDPFVAPPSWTMSFAEDSTVKPRAKASVGVDAPADPHALPFDDPPILPPRAARTPLAVRRATPEVHRNRPRTTRPIKPEAPLEFEPERSAHPRANRVSADETVASLMQTPSLAARVGAGIIDLTLLAAIDAIVVVLTLRMAGLETTADDLRVLPAIPFLGFLTLLAFGYVASFTVAGGQTIGKMLLSLRVVGDDGRPVDAAGGVLRAAGCMLVPVTLGLSFVPALFSSDHRALHDRLAGTRVVCE